MSDAIPIAASPGADAAKANVDFGEIPVATDMVAVAARTKSEPAADTNVTGQDKPDYGSDELFTDNHESAGVKPNTSENGNAIKSDVNTVSDTSKTSKTAKTFDAQESSGIKIAQSSDQSVLRGNSSVAPSEAARQIDELTRQILFKEIELQRYNLHYTLEVAKQGRWKGWRYALFQEINSGTGLAGSIISVANRAQGLHNPKRVKLYPQEAANYIPMIGSIIGASAAAQEFGINAYHEMIARSRGFSPAAAVRKVDGLQNDIDALLDKREALMRIEGAESSLHEYYAVDDVEGRVLKDMRDQALMEFERFHIGARKTLMFQQTQYLFDVSKFVTNAVGCNWAYLSLKNHHRIWNGRAGIMFTISGQLTMYAPILSRLFAKGYGEFTKLGMRDLRTEARETTMDKLSHDLDDLERIVKEHREHNPEVATTVVTQGDYESHEKCFADEIRSAQKKSDAAKLTATQNIGAGLFVGGCKTAQGVLFLVPGFNPNYNKGDYRSSHVTNELLFTSAVIGLPANTFSMLDTLRIQVRGEINRHRAQKSGQLPGQIVARRLKELDQMEAKLKAQ